MTTSYNTIYNRLVTSEIDMLGVCAYAIYKRQKLEVIQTLLLKNGAPPSPADLAPFHELSNSPSQLASYRKQAELLAEDFLSESLKAESDSMEQFYTAHAAAQIKRARPRFWSGVAQSIIGAIAFTLLMGTLVFFTWSLNQGPKHVLEQVFDIQILPKVIPS